MDTIFELKNRTFFRRTLILMMPVILQQLITIGINFLDNLMIGSFGEVSIAAAAFGNQVYAFFQFICMGLGSGAVVMSSQFWGRKDLDATRTTAAISLRVTAAICALFTILSAAWPGVLLRIFTNDAAVLAAGRPYMRLIGTTFLLAGLSSTATYLMRSVGRVNIPLIGSAIAFFLNLFFNWVFIFGKLGAPRLELVGAAVGTVIARAFEFLFVFGYFLLREDRFSFRVRHFALPGGALRREYARYSLPVLFSDTLLGLSLALTSVIYGHISAEISAAVSIANSVIQLITVVNVGMAGASAIVVGNTIGEGDLSRAKREGNTYILLSFLFGLVMIAQWRDLLAIMFPYLLACISFGLMLSWLVRYRENVLLLVVFTSVPFLFLSGVSWPLSSVTPFWQGVGALIPSTYAIRAYVRVASMGATVFDVLPELRALCLQAGAYFLAASVVMWRTRKG